MNNSTLKNEVKTYWNRASCGTDATKKPKFSYEYFEEIEKHRYTVEKQIFSFAQFTRFHGKKILEVGVGAGSDFLQWVRAGTHAYGIDLTQEAIDNVQERLKIYGLQATELKVADAENLPFQDNSFDLVWSWGVIHHSPNTAQCLREIIRVTQPGGTIKIMVYNRYSFFTFYLWLKHALLKGKPFQSFSSILFNHQESLGTKGYTPKEIKELIKNQPVTLKSINTQLSSYDLSHYSRRMRYFFYPLISLWGWSRCGWFMMIELTKNS